MPIKPPRVRLSASELIWSMMSGESRLLMTLEMSNFDREIRKQKIRRDHPEWSELEVMHEIIRQAFLPDLAPAWLEKQMRERLEQQRASS